MGINVTNVKTVGDVTKLLAEVENVEEFMLSVESSKLLVTKNDYMESGIIKNCLIGYEIKKRKTITEQWYKIEDELIVVMLKDFFEKRNFITYNGKNDYAILLSQGIKLNIIKDYYTSKNNEILSKLLSKNSAYNAIRKLILCRSLEEESYTLGEYECQQGVASYFGVGIDRAKLEEAYKKKEESLVETETKLKEKLGGINIRSASTLRNALKEKTGIELDLTTKGINKAIKEHKNNKELIEVLELIKVNRKEGRVAYELRRIRKKLQGDIITITNSKNGIDGAELDCITENKLIKPTENYSVILVKLENCAEYKLAYRIDNRTTEPRNHYLHLASKVFNKPQKDITEQELKAIKKASFYLMNPRWFNRTREVIEELVGNSEDIINKTKKALINTEYNCSYYSQLNILTDLKEILMRQENYGMYHVVKSLYNIHDGLITQAIVNIAKYFGKDNFRIRFLMKEYYGLYYEVANGDVEKFIDYIKRTGIDLGNGNRINLEIAAVITEK